MTIRELPPLPTIDAEGARALDFTPSIAELDCWSSGIRASGHGADRTIDILDQIGHDPWSDEGVGAAQVSAALAEMGPGQVTVNINSPGGDFFEGVTIYSLLREHAGEVLVNIMGVAGSAASVIAMAGDQIAISAIGFVFIHNAQAVAMGNRHVMLQAHGFLEPIDEAMAALYAHRSGKEPAELATLMDSEKFFSGQAAVDFGLADSIMASTQIVEVTSEAAHGLKALRRVEASLRHQGISRSESRALISELKAGKPSAAQSAARDAGEFVAGARRLIETMKA